VTGVTEKLAEQIWQNHSVAQCMSVYLELWVAVWDKFVQMVSVSVSRISSITHSTPGVILCDSFSLHTILLELYCVIVSV